MLLSLRISLTAVVIGCAIGLPLGAAIAVSRRSRAGARSSSCSTRLLGLPPVVVGLVVYLLAVRVRDRSARWDSLFTPTAMVIAQ